MFEKFFECLWCTLGFSAQADHGVFLISIDFQDHRGPVILWISMNFCDILQAQNRRRGAPCTRGDFFGDFSAQEKISNWPSRFVVAGPFRTLLSIRASCVQCPPRATKIILYYIIYIIVCLRSSILGGTCDLMILTDTCWYLLTLNVLLTKQPEFRFSESEVGRSPVETLQ
jgi:hypothetical protein